MIKILHIHTDKKFLRLIPAFNNETFNNQMIYFYEDEVDLTERYPLYNIIYKPITKKALREAIDLANSVDLIVLYNMNLINSYICNRISSKVRIIWRFFGCELYERFGSLMFSDITLSILRKNKVSILKRLKNSMNNSILFGITYLTEKKRAMLRADAIAVLYRQEYELLSKKFALPIFIQLPFEHDWKIKPYKKKEDTIIIGNNRSRYNNHLDILQIINRVNVDLYEYILPFNYGEESLYTMAVRDAASHIKRKKFIEVFLSLEEYNELFENSAAIVINAYRQMAMGNILMAIKNNVKVYLSTKNSAYDWLKDEGFHVFSIEGTLETDLRNNEIYLTKEDLVANRRAMENLNCKYSNNRFFDSVIELLN